MIKVLRVMTVSAVREKRSPGEEQEGLADLFEPGARFRWHRFFAHVR